MFERQSAEIQDDLRQRLQNAGCRAEVHYTAEIDSTNRWAMDEGAKGATAPAWYVADMQTAGKGRLGRVWSSPPRGNLYASCLLRPTTTPQLTPQISLATALAVHSSLASFCKPAIKWPNDVWIGDKKIAGVLSELSASPEHLEHLVVGVGINVESQIDDFPPELRETATSLHLAGAAVSRADVFTKLAKALENYLSLLEADGFQALRDEWNAASLLTGRMVTVAFGRDEKTGMVDGLDAEGYLLLRTSTGIDRIVAGDVTVRK